MCIYFPAFMGYLSIVKQKEAGTASSGQNALVFITCGVLVLAGSALTRALGLGWYLTALAGLHVTCAVLATWQILQVKARHRQLPLQAPLPLQREAGAEYASTADLPDSAVSKAA